MACGSFNRINGLITPFRPVTLESAAGKNPVTHVGKLYNLAAALIAQRLVDELPSVDKAQCVMASRIGGPLQSHLRAASRKLASAACILRRYSSAKISSGATAIRIAQTARVSGGSSRIAR
jgi:S-adenosylmethionine synthetase